MVPEHLLSHLKAVLAKPLCFVKPALFRPNFCQSVQASSDVRMGWRLRRIPNFNGTVVVSLCIIPFSRISADVAEYQHAGCNSPMISPKFLFPKSKSLLAQRFGLAVAPFSGI